MVRLKMIIILIILILPLAATGSPPSLMKRNIDIDFNLDSNPEKVGDLLSIEWSFILRHEVDSFSRVIFEEYDTTRIVKAYLHTAGSLEYVSGDTLWWGIPDYDKEYTFTTTFRIAENDLIAVRPTIETHNELYKKSMKTRNSIKGCLFDFRIAREYKENITITPAGDTIIDRIGYSPPSYPCIDDSYYPKLLPAKTSKRGREYCN